MKKQTLSTSSSLPPPFPAAPQRCATTGIYITHEDKPHVINYIAFAADYSTSAWLKAVLQVHGEPDTINRHDLVFESGWKLSTRSNSTNNDLPALLARSPQGAEQQYANSQELLSGFAITRRHQASQPTLASPPKNNTKHPRVKPSSEDVTFLADICKDPSLARQLLRKANFPKPAGGWSWPKDSADIEEAKKIIGAN